MSNRLDMELVVKCPADKCWVMVDDCKCCDFCKVVNWTIDGDNYVGCDWNGGFDSS